MEDKLDVLAFEKPSPLQQQCKQEGEKQTHDENDKNLSGKKKRQQVQKPREQIVSECRDYLNIIREKCGREDSGKRPLNVVILGTQGCGKSSFINSLAASLSQDKWIEYTMVGYRNKATPITTYISQHIKCCNDDRRLYKNVLLPTLIDIAGLQLEDEKQMKKFLRLLFYGHIENREDTFRVYADCTKDWEDLKETYSTVYDDMKVDRVIFVASAVNENLPERLMDCVMESARPSSNPQGFKRQVPVYGVLTNFDEVDDANRENFDQTKAEFMRALGLQEGRFLCCSNYCDDTDPDKERFNNVIPSLDLPILQFFSQVCESKTPIAHHDDRIPVDFIAKLRGDWRRLSSTTQAWVTSLVVAFLSFVAVYVFHAIFLRFQQDVMLSERCRAGDRSVADLCQATRTPSSLKAALCAGIIVFITFWCYRLLRSS